MKKIAPLAVAYVGLAVLANWLASRYVWPVGFGLLAPGGVFAIGGGNYPFKGEGRWPSAADGRDDLC